MSPRTRQLLDWLPRVLGALYAVFISVFAFDVWEMSGSFWYKMAGFLIHLIPTYLVVAVLLAGWVRPLWGGIGYLTLAVAFGLIFGRNDLSVLLILTGPLILVGLLFLADWWVSNSRLHPKF
ncbi:MAG: hypothetical protein R6X18_03255 [Chloroflexota bacterium]|jgi:TRAP-type C4-dicarboxylate transport system permease small subunit